MSHVQRDDPRYPRRGWFWIWRWALLGGWALLTIYTAPVVINLIMLVGQGIQHFFIRREIVSALLLPKFLADPAVPAIAIAPFGMLYALVFFGGVWALHDRDVQRDVLHRRSLAGQPQSQQRYGGRTSIGSNTGGDGSPSLHIISLTGAYTPWQAPLMQDTITFGSGSDNTIVVNDQRVSHAQFVLRRIADQWRLQCLPDATTTYVNGAPRTEANLRAHDQLVVGASMLRFNAPEPVTTTANAERAPKLVVICTAAHFTAALRDAKITLGRSPDCGIVIPSSIVSHHHAELIRMSEATYQILDTASANGLYVKGKRVKVQRLRHGDTISIGAGSGVEMVMLRYLAYGPSEADESEAPVDSR